MQIQDFATENIHCTNCEGRVKKLLHAIEGISNAQVNVLRKTMRVEFDEQQISVPMIVAAMEQAGYQASPIQGSNAVTLIPTMQEVTSSKISSALHGVAKSPKKKTDKHVQVFNTENIHCTNCEGRVKNILNAIEGIKQVDVNVLRKTMRVEFDPEQINIAKIITAMEEAGYKASPVDDVAQSNVQIPTMQEITGKPKENTPTNTQKKTDPIPTNLTISLIFASLLMYVAMGEMLALPLPTMLKGPQNIALLALLQLLLCAPILYANRHIFRSGLAAAMDKSPNMDTLVGLGSAAAAIFGIYALMRITLSQDAAIIEHWGNNLYFDSAGMILALIGLGKHFESKARRRASKAIDELTNLTPTTAICLRNGQEITIPTRDVVKGDILIVHAGQSIAADGIITQGTAFIDESIITGESLPVEKSIGQKVIGASISTSGYFQMQVTGVGEQTTLARIIRLVDEALSTKAPIARLADRISAIFVPIIISIALLSFASWLLLGYGLEFAMSAAISVLVISCPCALGLATPTAIMVGTGMGAERGILFKSAAAIELIHTANTVVLDKTGTLTHGKPKVTDIIPVQAGHEQELLQIAASIEQFSEHPLGQAIVKEAEARDVKLTPAEEFKNFKQLPGLGLTLNLGDTSYMAGNVRLLAYENIENTLNAHENSLNKQGKTELYFTKDNVLLGIIAVADSIKANSAKAVQELQELGLNVLMLTGDNQSTAEAIQAQVGIKEIMAQVLPAEKEGKIRSLQEQSQRVIMVGDGINDAPALARADIGIAIGTGTDIAMQSADVVLMTGDVAQVASAYKLSQAVMRTIRQNLFWAFAYNIVLIPVAAGLLYIPFSISLNPMFAAASMSLSSLTVVGNALRLKTQQESIFF